MLQHIQHQHVAAWAALEKQCFSLPWSEEQCAAVLQQKHFTALGLWLNAENTSSSTSKNAGIAKEQEFCAPLAKSAHTLTAYVSFYHMFDEMEILNIAVDPQARRQGYGAFVLTAAVHFAKENAIEKIILEVREGNVAARCLYEKFSFHCVGIRRKYYTDTGEDACIYTLAL